MSWSSVPDSLYEQLVSMMMTPSMTMIFKEGCGQLPRVIPLRRLQQSLSPWKALDKGIFDDDDDDDDDEDDDDDDDDDYDLFDLKNS